MISVGIDVSKGKSTVCIMKPYGEIIKAPYEIIHSRDDLNALVTFIKSQKEEVWAVMEDTGHYHWPILLFLYEHGIKVSCVNSLRMKKYCSQSIRRAKTDANDKNSEIIRAFYAFVQNKLHFAVTGQTAAELIFSVYVRIRNMYQNLISKPKNILRANSKQPMR